MSRSIVWTGVLAGSTLGSLVPLLWGASMFSLSSMVCSGLGAFAGIWLAYKFSGY